MKERGLLFSPVMVKATIDDIKTMTRRTRGLDKINENPDDWEYVRFYDQHAKFCEKYNHVNEVYVKCPYGVVEDVIYVKETFYAFGHWNYYVDEFKKKKWTFNDLTELHSLPYFYETDPPKSIVQGRGKIGWYKRPSLFMPKIAARTYLRIKDISVDRIQNISNKDAKSEGVSNYFSAADMVYAKGLDFIIPKPFLEYQFSFMVLWCKLNGTNSWEKNPYVWIVKFKKINKS